MKCLIIFSGENNKIRFDLSSDELVKVIYFPI